MTKYKIYVDASSNLLYSSYYVEGFYTTFGKNNVHFSSKHFKDLSKRDDEWSYDSYMAVKIVEKHKSYKIIIDFGDDVPIRKYAYAWCDVYAKINYNPRITGYFDKVHPIAPGFGIKIWNLLQISFFSISNLIKLNLNPQIPLLKHFHNYFSQLKLHRIETFAESLNSEVNGDYVFFIATLWPHQNCLTGTNLLRQNYMEACKDAKVNFEGGFFLPDDAHPQRDQFSHLIFKKRYLLREFIQKTKKSAIVFNTPAVHNCHGWKLGQFLAMGKAIISTTLENDLEPELIHGQHIHFISDVKELNAAIIKLLTDDVYRRRLEDEAKSYYANFAQPSAVIKSILQKADIKIN